MEWIVEKECPEYKFSTKLRSTSTVELVMGKCDFDRKTIYMHKDLYEHRYSYWMLYLDVLFHEIAHAHAGSRAGHGERWRRTYERLLASYEVDAQEAATQKETFYDEVILPLQKERAKTTMYCGGCSRYFYFQRSVRGTYFCSHCRVKLKRI